MSTTVKVLVNGTYRATVKQDDKDPVVIEGNLDGGTEKSFYLSHPANSTFVITEESMSEVQK